MTDYTKQRAKRTPPHVSLRDVRNALGLTLDQVIERIYAETKRAYTRGALSAIETGQRGASKLILNDIAQALGLPSDACSTDYEPRSGDGKAA